MPCHLLPALAVIFCFAANPAVAHPPTAKSDFVPLMPKGRVYLPIPVQGTSAGKQPLADRPEIVPAACVPDFTIDGSRSNPFWETAPAHSRFWTPGENPKEFPYKSDIRLLYSKTALYIGGVCRQPMEQMTARYDQNDLSVWEDDCVELFFYLQGASDQRHLYQYVINPLGAMADLCDSAKGFHAKGSQVRVRRSSDGWSFELKIPFAGIPADRPFGGDVWGIRLCRSVRVTNDSGTFPHLVSGGYGQQGNFAGLRFLPPAEASSEAAAEADAYRKEMSIRRFYRRFEALSAHIREVRAATACLDRRLEVYGEALQAVEQVSGALEAFESKHRDVLAGRRLPPREAVDGLFSEYEGFCRYASSQAYLVWETDKWATGSPSEVPPACASSVVSLAFRQAGNEREAVCLNMAGLLCGLRLDLRLVPQTLRKDGKFLSCDAFEVYQEPFIRYGNGVITAPLIRCDGNIVTLTPGRSTRVWIVFNSRGVKPGEYCTGIALKPAYESRVAVRTLPVSVRVWNFALPEPREWPLKSFFWGPHQWNNDEVQVLERMHDYHVSHGWTKGHLYTYGLTDQDWYAPPRAKFAQDFDPELARTANEAFFQAAKRLGMKFVFGWGTPSSPEWFKTMSARLYGMGFKDGDFIFKSLIADEFRKADIPKEAAKRDAVRRVCTNWWFQNVWLSVPPPHGATIEDIDRAGLADFYRQWTLIHDLCEDAQRGPEAIAYLRGKGCEVWSYQCRLYMQSQDLLSYYRLWLWECYRMGLDGAAMWCSGGREGDDGFDSSDGYDDGIMWVGNDRKFITTKRFEAFREGLEDVAYMDRLKREIARLEASGKTVPRQARNLLDACRGIILQPSQKQVDWWRNAVGACIDRLTRE